MAHCVHACIRWWSGRQTRASATTRQLWVPLPTSQQPTSKWCVIEFIFPSLHHGQFVKGRMEALDPTLMLAILNRYALCSTLTWLWKQDIGLIYTQHLNQFTKQFRTSVWTHWLPKPCKGVLSSQFSFLSANLNRGITVVTLWLGTVSVPPRV